jgi:hypothetical protein
VCKAATAQKKAQGPFPYPDFNPTRPDWSKYSGVAAGFTTDYYEGGKTQDKLLQAANAAGVSGCAEVDR